MEDELKNEFPDIEIIPGSAGIFDVRADHKKIFSKKQTNRFPEPGEILAILKSL